MIQWIARNARAMCSVQCSLFIYILFCVQSQSKSGKLNQCDTVELNQIDGWLYTFFMWNIIKMSSYHKVCWYYKLKSTQTHTMSEKEIRRKSHERTTSHTHLWSVQTEPNSLSHRSHTIYAAIFHDIDNLCARCMLFFIAAAPFVAFFIHLFLSDTSFCNFVQCKKMKWNETKYVCIESFW